MDEGSSNKKRKIKVKSSHTGNKKFSFSWLLTTVLLTFFLSVIISFFTASRLQDVALGVAFLLLFVIILIGIIFDMVGTAVAAASEIPFHAMASKKVAGALYAVRLIKHNEKVSNVCNDVIGDICGIISGSVGSVIVADIVLLHEFNFLLTSLLVTGIISSLTVGGKAAGKTMAISNCNTILFLVGKILYFFGRKK